jgi:enamine deaminase RidA (YjgF/YER057c/UK114 family)
MQPTDWPRPKGYAYSVVAQGRMVFISGIMGWDPRTHVLPDGFLLQVRQALTAIVALLHEAEATAADIVRMTWYVVDKREYLGVQKELGAVYREVIGRHFPTMTVVEAGLLEEKARVEIEVTAVVPRGG